MAYIPLFMQPLKNLEAGSTLSAKEEGGGGG